ncbi:hypothetical protein PGT21_029156 [Puccinia graminis f. sp. tritici]|uniref:Uncharacterized protein n=1 Tax=Puccinia graminis f. sp. tritici TaxID=56615 RepID=A0A5B0P713_PUCGR|nr:hypothetical protein PGT21_029156 [Puccinia graminis f. sp. tritici]KAA1108057.1 hypothetical protein PGTUg99_027132 [Puccinia graminis f. sp. tritici]
MASKNHRSIISAPIIHVGLVPWSNKEQIAQARQTSITNDQRLIIQAYVCRTENRQAYGGRKAERLAHTEKGMPACYETASCLGSCCLVDSSRYIKVNECFATSRPTLRDPSDKSHPTFNPGRFLEPTGAGLRARMSTSDFIINLF